MEELEVLLENALAERSKQFEPAMRDLDETTAKASDVIRKVRGGELDLVLVPLEPITGKGDAFSLTLLHGEEERILRIFEFGDAGYPLKVWGALESWRERSDLKSALSGAPDLVKFFRELISSPKSEVVAYLKYLRGNAATNRATAAAN